MITEAFGEPDDNAVASTGQCCDVCDMPVHQLKDCREELEIAIDTIHTLGPRGEVKLSEWIRGNKRPWMEAFDKSKKSFANGKRHTELWWRSFFRKYHVLGLLERRLSNMAKANQHYAVMAVYHTTSKGEKAVNEQEAVMMPESTVCTDGCGATAGSQCGKKILFERQDKAELVKQKSRVGKGGRIIDRLRDLLIDKENWREISCRNDYLYPGVFPDVMMRHMLYTPDITTLKPDSQKGMQNDFMWKDIQFSKGKLNMPRQIAINIGGKAEKLQYRMAPCAGVKMCPQQGCCYIAAIKEHHSCPHHQVPLVKQCDCPVYFVYVEPIETTDKRRWIAGLVLHQKASASNLHSHATPPPSSLFTFTVCCARCCI